jgi:hypothetical protein
MKTMLNALAVSLLATAGTLAGGCGDDGAEPALVAIENDFDNPTFDAQPPWTLCDAWFQGTYFGRIPRGERSELLEVEPGVGLVFMVASFADPDCNDDNLLPLATVMDEEALAGVERTVFINLPNHRGPCPPRMDVPMISEESYNRVLELFPDAPFEPYERRTENTQCQDE